MCCVHPTLGKKESTHMTYIYTIVNQCKVILSSKVVGILKNNEHGIWDNLAVGGLWFCLVVTIGSCSGFMAVYVHWYFWHWTHDSWLQHSLDLQYLWLQQFPGSTIFVLSIRFVWLWNWATTSIFLQRGTQIQQAWKQKTSPNNIRLIQIFLM